MRQELNTDLKADIPSHVNSCLPLTFELANVPNIKRVILKYFGGINCKWPFEDRVLVWVVPNFIDEVKNFHNNNGPDMEGLYNKSQIELLDEDILKALIVKIETIYPDFQTILKDAINNKL